MPQPRETEPPVRFSSNSQGGSVQGSRARSTTPLSRQWPSTSSTSRHPSHPDGRGSSVHFPVSSFSFRGPNWTNHLVNRVPQSNYNPHTAFVGNPSAGREPSGPTQRSAQTSAPVRPSKRCSSASRVFFLLLPGRSIVGNSLSSENLSVYAEISRQSEREWEGTAFVTRSGPLVKHPK